jgi:hypothetical protein
MLGGGASIFSNGNFSTTFGNGSYGISTGNMLVSSYPYNATSWYAEGKDHLYFDIGNLQTYVIGIQTDIPNFGSIISGISGYPAVTSGAGNSTLYGFMSTTSRQGVLTCPGAQVTYNGVGRMLNAISIGPDVNVSSSDSFLSSLSTPETGPRYYARSRDTGFNGINYDGGSITGYCMWVGKY